MNYLILSKIKNIIFNKKENLFIIEKYFEDFYLKKNSSKITLIKPYNAKNIERTAAYIECNEVYNNILKNLARSLNELHKVSYNIRSWEIILGDWLLYYIWILYERFNTLKSIISENKFDKIYGVKNDNFNFAGEKTTDIINSSIDHDWNSNLYFKILNYLGVRKNVTFYTQKLPLKNNRLINNQKNILKKIYEKFLKLFSFIQSDKDAIVINSYLPPLYEKLFEIILFQFPKIWKFKKIKFKDFDFELRSKICLEKTSDISFENFAMIEIKNFLPICIVESFSQILNDTKKIGFPKNPKFIFTSNDFEGSIFFKLFTANILKEKKVKFIIGQHGNTYFSDLRDDKFRTEFNICDKFLTWGYSKLPKFKKSFNFSAYGRKKYKEQSKKKLLVVVSPIDYKIYPYDTIPQTESGYINVINTLDLVDKKITENTIIRLSQDYTSPRGMYYLNKYFRDISVKTEMGKRSFVKARNDSKLTFFNYDSTGILENLALNYPTVCMWSNLGNNINKKFMKKYQLLIKAKILFLSEVELAKHINLIWNNIDEWWLAKETQEHINEFNKDFNFKGNLKSLFELKKLCMEKNVFK